MMNIRKWLYLSAAGFIAGFLAVPLFHQISLGAFYLAGVTPIRPYDFSPTQPFGVPVVLSASCWGGVWGVLFAWTVGRLHGRAYWLLSILFGALALSFIAAVIVAPLKHLGLVWGWNMGRLGMVLVINGFWGVGTAAGYALLKRLFH